MKIRERLSGACRRIRDAALWRRWLRVWNAANENPFPAQAALVVVYRLALDVVYLKAVSPVYAYSGFTTELEPLRYGVSLLTLACFAPFLAHLTEDRRPSSILCTFLSSVYFIPLTSYFGCRGAGWDFFAIAVGYWALLLAFQLCIPSPALAPLKGRHVTMLAKLMTAGCVALVFFISGRYAGFRLTLDFIDVYGIRAEAAGYAIPTVLSYLLSFMPVAMALLLTWWLGRKSRGAAALLVVAYLFLFSISATKAIFFFLLVVLAGWFLYRPWMLRWHTGLLTLLAGGCLVCYRVLGSIIPMSLVINRIMYSPVHISNQLLAIFRENPVSLFRDSILGKLSLDPLFSITIPRITGEWRGHPLENANNGLLGDLFSNLPLFPGLLLMPLVLILCFRLLDLSAGRSPEKVAAVVCVYFAMGFSNGSWSTVLLSGGFLLACVLLYIFFNESKEGTHL